MRTISKFLLGATLLACGTRDREAVDIELVMTEDTSARSSNTATEAEAEEAGGTGTAMALEEGKMGWTDRQRAIEAARAAGILGSNAQSGGFASLTATGDVSSGFDDRGGGETYRDHGKNPWTQTTKDRISTFAADVDTASYTLARRKLREGALPQPASVRVEEYVNYFDYKLPEPAADTPFSVVMDAAPSPLAADRHVVRVAVGTKAIAKADRLPANLVFLVDVSGSMTSSDKLELAKKSLRILVAGLRDGDTVGLVTYAGDTRVVLRPTGMHHKSRIVEAIDALGAGGSTAMASGIDLAYREAAKGLRPGTTSRVVVLSDGDANVGPRSHDEILKIIEGRAKEGVTLSTIGFGIGNYRDDLMEQLADKGNGNNFYIDDLDAAKKLFEDKIASTLDVVAKDVKLQVEFDPAIVSRYRLVGYENRDVADKDFRNDRVDAGEVGPGHQVTALYEIELTPAGKQTHVPIGAVRIRHKQPRGEHATEAAFPMIGAPAVTFASAPADFRFAYAVSAFADVLRGADDAKQWSLTKIRDLARDAAGTDGERKQLVQLIERAIALRGRTS